MRKFFEITFLYAGAKIIFGSRYRNRKQAEEDVRDKFCQYPITELEVFRPSKKPSKLDLRKNMDKIREGIL